MRWQVQEAKQKFSELVQRALDEGPQTVTRRGEEVVVVVSAEEFRQLTEARPPRMSFHDFLMSGPDFSDLDLDRPIDYGREVDL